MTITVDGTSYQAEKLKIGPNLAKYDAQCFGLIGPRGAGYLLSQSVKGFWVLMAVSHQVRKTYPLNVSIEEVSCEN